MALSAGQPLTVVPINDESFYEVPSQAPTVSVIVPAYNAANFTAKCLDSVFAQNLVDFQVIVINEGSLDTPARERVLGP